MFKKNFITVWLGILIFSGMFLMGQESWPPPDNCAFVNCGENGTCVDGTCECAAGFDGEFCDNNIPDCPNPDPCEYGSCVDGIESYTCACDAGYDGTLCDNNIDDCDPDPCTGNTICIDGIDEYTCECAVGYSGPSCGTVDFMKVFVSAGTSNGNLGGIAGADAICQQEAEDAQLIGDFLAWISTSSANQPATRFNKSSLPYKLVDGTLIADNWTNLTANVGLYAPINLDAAGELHAADYVRTNTDQYGVVISTAYNMNCQQFTAGYDNTHAGRTQDYLTYRWTRYAWSGCNWYNRIYCFQQ